MYDSGSFRKDIHKQCILCYENNSKEHIVNKCTKLNKMRKELKLNKLDKNTIDKCPLDAIN